MLPCREVISNEPRYRIYSGNQNQFNFIAVGERPLLSATIVTAKVGTGVSGRPWISGRLSACHLPGSGTHTGPVGLHKLGPLQLCNGVDR